jgi:ribosome-associated protein
LKAVSAVAEQAGSDAAPALPPLESEPLARDIAAVAANAKAIDIEVLRVLELVEYTDWFVICSARSDRHARAIYDLIWDELALEGKKPLSSEGVEAGQWILADYGSVVVHIFYEPVREFYALERLWADAPRLPDIRQATPASGQR